MLPRRPYLPACLKQLYLMDHAVLHLGCLVRHVQRIMSKKKEKRKRESSTRPDFSVFIFRNKDVDECQRFYSPLHFWVVSGRWGGSCEQSQPAVSPDPSPIITSLIPPIARHPSLSCPFPPFTLSASSTCLYLVHKGERLVGFITASS